MAMMFRHSLGLETEAVSIETAVDQAITKGARTVDVGGELSTKQMADEVIALL
jgi:3-isopropylmalate dehydrogenase